MHEQLAGFFLWNFVPLRLGQRFILRSKVATLIS